MQIQLTGHHVDITDALREFVHDKFAKLERHFDHLVDVHVILSVEKLTQKAEADIRPGDGGRVFADASADDMYAAIDLLVGKLDRQLRKHKEKARDRRKSPASRAATE